MIYVKKKNVCSLFVEPCLFVPYENIQFPLHFFTRSHHLEWQACLLLQSSGTRNQHCTRGSPQTSSLSTSYTSQPSNVATRGLVPVYVHPDCLPDIEAALRFLGLPPLLNPGGNHAQATAPSHEEDLDNPVVPQFQQRSGPQRETWIEDELRHLATSFTQLSTSDGSSQVSSRQASFPVRRPTVVQPDTSPRKSLKKYYVVTIGKRTGVFWEEW